MFNTNIEIPFKFVCVICIIEAFFTIRVALRSHYIYIRRLLCWQAEGLVTAGRDGWSQRRLFKTFISMKPLYIFNRWFGTFFSHVYDNKSWYFCRNSAKLQPFFGRSRNMISSIPLQNQNIKRTKCTLPTFTLAIWLIRTANKKIEGAEQSTNIRGSVLCSWF